MTIGIIDYGMGNLRSVQKAFEKIGVTAEISSDPERLDQMDKLVLPGVGAITDAMVELQHKGLVDFIHHGIESGRPFLGICLGFQLLFNRSEENGGCAGLGIFPGSVVRFQLPHDYAVPHMGWNQLHFQKEVPLFKGIDEGDYVYFVHSYYVVSEKPEIVATTTDYCIDFCSSIAQNNVFGTQFHPEKSQAVGLKILKNFANLE